MADFSLGRLIAFISVVAATSFCIFGFATMSFGSAIVGETRRVDLGTKAPASLEAVKARLRAGEAGAS